jgi:hypothetical protein
MNFRAQRLGLGASTFSMSPFAAGTGERKNLGQTEQLLYSRAKTAVAEFDSLQAKTHGGLNGELALKLSTLVKQAEASNPANYAAFSAAQKDIEALEDLNRTTKAALAAEVPAKPETASDDGKNRCWMMPLGVLCLVGAFVLYKMD